MKPLDLKIGDLLSWENKGNNIINKNVYLLIIDLDTENQKAHYWNITSPEHSFWHYLDYYSDQGDFVHKDLNFRIN